MIKSRIFLIISIIILIAFIAFSTHILAFIVFPVVFFVSILIYSILLYKEHSKTNTEES